jgi:hypothetical protein
MGIHDFSDGEFYEKLSRQDISVLFRSDSLNDWIYRAVTAT